MKWLLVLQTSLAGVYTIDSCLCTSDILLKPVTSAKLFILLFSGTALLFRHLNRLRQILSTIWQAVNKKRAPEEGARLLHQPC
ncbi:hypothetical protein [Deminuibacter soli]|uniref:Uncharacterized protein n=1 Tax=Deminuibacter soli TaxID=2291815 RepID=A0A3E1NLG6_9BACT|nr:hypothetical protein [Deminuibacter soli]RFM28775.1 hypothetical protein DXN05_08325 [Deminuibacter soli]